MTNHKTLIILTACVCLQAVESTSVGILTANLKKACSLAQSLRQAGQKANHDTAARLSDVETLSELAEDLAAIVRSTPLAANSKAKLVAELARHSAQEALNIVSSNLNKIFDLTATAANIAGNIQESAHLLLNSKNAGTSECVSDAAEFAGVTVSSTAIPGCLKAGGDFDDGEWRPNLQDADIHAAVNALPSGDTGITGSGSTCKLMHYTGGRSTTGSVGTTMMAGLITLGANAANAPTFTAGRTAQLLSTSRIGKVHTAAASLSSTIGTATPAAAKLLQLVATAEPADLTIDIAQGSLGDNYPANVITITKEETKAIHKMIKKHRADKDTEQLRKARDIFFRNDMEVNKTACDLGEKLSAKQDCEVTKTDPQKCEGKDQGECDTKEGEGTTNAVGDGDGAKEGTAASSGCAQHFNDKDKCEKMNEGKEKPVCAWKKGGENDKDKDELRCRNGSFLVNNQFALSVVSAAFVALLF
uniref:Variant surface glycoprotein n=1 Tax=Trypanosoma brucei TaxID=5691 RepID=S5FVT2_9TRYP|nr:variant surface glycoprotein [Trypanosoma brucei]